MRRSGVIISLIVIAAVAGVLIYYSAKSLHKTKVVRKKTVVESEQVERVRKAPDHEAWADADKVKLKGLPKREKIDWDAEGAEHLPERPNQPVEVRDEEIELDEEGLRHIVKDRVNVMLDDESLSMTTFASDFKKIYPQDEYEIIYADPQFRRLQLKVPDGEREEVKKRLLLKYGEEKIIVWDEAIMKSEVHVNDWNIDSCWYHDVIHTFKAWDLTMGSGKIVVAVLDDGFELENEELKGRVVMPFNVFTRTDDVSESPTRHGTHVAGLILAEANNRIGMAGIAPKCKFMPVKVFDSYGNATFTSVLDAMMYAIYNKADVVNLSVETSFEIEMTEAEMNALIKTRYKAEERLWKSIFATANRNNTTVVIPAGNENILAGIEPMQRSENVIVVAAVDRSTQSLRKSDFSNWGSYTDVSAPGSEMFSTVGKNGYVSMTGTSMASPIVAGAVALMKSLNHDLTTKQITTILQRTGLRTKGRVGRLIQLDAALECVKNKVIPPAASIGALQILLSWSDLNDLDLYCKEPSGEIIYFKHKISKSGGTLEIDMNVKPPYCNIPIENIFWSDKDIPKGRYEIYVQLFTKRADKKKSEYEVVVRNGRKEKRYYGFVEKEKEKKKVCEFVIE